MVKNGGSRLMSVEMSLFLVMVLFNWFFGCLHVGWCMRVFVGNARQLWCWWFVDCCDTIVEANCRATGKGGPCLASSLQAKHQLYIMRDISKQVRINFANLFRRCYRYMDIKKSSGSKMSQYLGWSWGLRHLRLPHLYTYRKIVINRRRLINRTVNSLWIKSRRSCQRSRLPTS